MSVRRALVECTVLSLQDSCVFYPCCKDCFCRMDEEPQDTTRSKCSKCAYSCVRDHLEHRYRLSLLVTRDMSIFGVTVFGSCLNPFFGMPATQFQRLLENSDGASEKSLRSKFLVRAVENCFVSRHLVFGIKVTDSQNCPWSRDYNPGASASKDMAQFTATQLIFPKATGQEVRSVLSYYQAILCKTEERRQLESDELHESRRILTTLPWIPQNSPARSFNNITLSRLFPHSLQRSQHDEGSLTPTPPWQQSLGLVTSSAEQEEEENRAVCDDNKSTDKEQRRNTFFDTPPFSFCSPGRNVRSASILNHFIPRVSTCQDSKQPDDSLVSRSLVWEDFPFSESLSAFLNEEDKYNTNECIPASTSNKKVPVGKNSTDVTITSVPTEECEEVYNCSLDLFGVSSTNPHDDDVKRPRLQKCIKRVNDPDVPSCDMITHRDYPQCDFIPSCQSTPICRTRPSSSSHSLSTTRHTRNTSKRRFRKHHLVIQRNILIGKTTPEHEWSFCDVPLSQSEDNSVIVPPIPAELKVEIDRSKEKMLPHLTQTEQRDVSEPDRNTLYDHTIDGVTVNGSLFMDKECDWSRDLFL
ncbi:uncharacterized protein ddias [Corythoichthys intestinalis]|uniref:uncharacterized protein ddias n=1 Tax=Corythoichthys intestinalis TaxID=161448 RepID=UPI0025A54211|nr:uncharacterized protein ddias [Corythoichthys intestinalis]